MTTTRDWGLMTDDRRLTTSEITPQQRERLEALGRWSHLLDSAFRVPGTKWRFGWDPLLGLVPGAGDILAPLFSILLVLQGSHMRLPKIVQARMVLNVAIDMVLGAVPVAGDLFDFAWKSNDKNLRLLERHAYETADVTIGDRVFVFSILGVLALCAVVPLVLLAWTLRLLGRGLL